jgi:glycosyltransferase involved in cell wall biosynthesis
MTQINNLQDQPLISVVIRTQNRPHLLKEALQSVAQQTYPFVEAVVVNDGGQSVKHIIEPFENKISGGLQLIEKPLKEGRSAAANTGIESAKGEWIAFLDDDDTFEPNGLEQLAQYIKWDKDIIYGQVNVWQMSVSNEENKLLATMGEYKPDALWLCNQIAICAYICKKENALKVGSFDCEFDYLEDWDFYFRLSQNARIQYVSQAISNYRVLGESFITGKNNQQETFYRQKFFEKHYSLFLPKTLFNISTNTINSLEEKHIHYKQELDKQFAAFQANINKHHTEYQQELSTLHSQLNEKNIQIQALKQKLINYQKLESSLTKNN